MTHLLRPLVLFITPLSVALLAAPATWLAEAVFVASGKRLQLADASGLWWRGSAWITISPGGDAALTLPGRISWTLLPLEAGLRIESAQWITQSFVLSWRGAPVLGAGSATLPAAVLQGFGPPFSTFRPAGSLRLSWRDADHLTADWTNAGTPLTALARLGDYRFEWANETLHLTTLNGPLHLDGERAPGQRFIGTARSDPEAAPQLVGLLNLLGPTHNGITTLRF